MNTLPEHSFVWENPFMKVYILIILDKTAADKSLDDGYL